MYVKISASCICQGLVGVEQLVCAVPENFDGELARGMLACKPGPHLSNEKNPVGLVI